MHQLDEHKKFAERDLRSICNQCWGLRLMPVNGAKSVGFKRGSSAVAARWLH